MTWQAWTFLYLWFVTLLLWFMSVSGMNAERDQLLAVFAVTREEMSKSLAAWIDRCKHLTDRLDRAGLLTAEEQLARSGVVAHLVEETEHAG